MGNLVHIHIDAAISSPIGDVHQGALQSGQSGQSLDFILADAGVKAYTAFAGAPQRGMLHPIALKQAYGAVVHLHRDGNFQLPLRVFHKFICHPVQTHLLGGLVHIVGKILIGIAVSAHRYPTFLHKFYVPFLCNPPLLSLCKQKHRKLSLL